MNDKVFNIILIIILITLIAILLAPKSNNNEPRQNECYSVLDYNSSEYIMCEIDMESK